MLYGSVFNEALNTKRSSCAGQLGGKIIRATISKFEGSGEDFYTIDKLSKLRRESIERKSQAFYWFFERTWKVSAEEGIGENRNQQADFKSDRV
jgi:hypothetical protein